MDGWMDGWTERGYSSIIVKVMSGGTLIPLSDVSRMQRSLLFTVFTQRSVIEPPKLVWYYRRIKLS